VRRWGWTNHPRGSEPTNRQRMADDSQQIGQNEIEQLLQQAKGVTQESAAEAPSAPAESGTVRQDEIDALLSGVGGGSSSAAATEPDLGGGPAMPPFHEAQQPTSGASSSGTSDDIQFLLDQAEQAIASVNDPSAAAEGLADFQFRDLEGTPPSDEKATLDLLRDVDLNLKIELGRTQMFLEDVLKLRRGSVVALDKLAGDPVDVYVNGRLIARGEVLVLNDNFCVRVAELISGDDQ